MQVINHHRYVENVCPGIRLRLATPLTQLQTLQVYLYWSIWQLATLLSSPLLTLVNNYFMITFIYSRYTSFITH